jgi:hypothetical protein
MRRTHDDSADKIAALAGLSSPAPDLGNIRETNDSVESQEAGVSDCFTGSPGRIHIHCKKAGNLCCVATSLYADTPKHAPADEWLFLDTPSLYWKVENSRERG